MKMRLSLFIAALFLFSFHAAAQWSDAVIGTWLSEDGKGKIQIYKSGNAYYGKLSWLKEPIDPDTGKPKLDKENPDDALQSQSLLGKVILTDFVFEDGYWQEGEIYDPESGKTYDCKMWLQDKDHLQIKGYWHFIHRIDTWTRTN